MPDASGGEPVIDRQEELLRLLKQAGITDARLPEPQPVIVPENIGIHLKVEQVQKAMIVSEVPSIEVRHHKDRMSMFSTLTLRSAGGEVTVFVSSADVARALLVVVQEIAARWPETVETTQITNLARGTQKEIT
jgi:hypothetical protein